MCLCVCARERAASRAGPEADNMGDGAERKLPGQTGAPALGEQRGETQEYLLEVIVISQFLNKISAGQIVCSGFDKTRLPNLSLF